MSFALRLDGVVKFYGRRKALDGLNLEVPAGSIFGLVGSNGAGKTTAMAGSVGLLRFSAGSVDLLGQGPFRPAAHAGRVSLLPQDSRLPLHARVGDLLHYYGRLQRVPEPRLRTAIDEVLEWVHLADRRASPVRTLSHGMARRLTIAQAFLGDPELVLLDEPRSGRDPREAVRIRDSLRDRKGRQTIVISSHNLRELEALCDRVAFVENGKLLRTDAMERMVRRHHRLAYAVSGAEDLPLADLKAALPNATFDVENEGKRLAVVFDDAQVRVEDVNAAVLPVLLRAGVGVLEVRRGSDLESEYLALTAPPPVPIPDPQVERAAYGARSTQP